jgi:SAM-dependent methyltransferase
MKLSELVYLRERLKSSFFLDPVLSSIDNLRLNIGLASQGASEDYSGMLGDLITDYRDIRTSVLAPTERVQQIIDKINAEINAKSSIFFLDNYELELQYDGPTSIRKVRVMYIPGQIQQEIENRIALYSSWKYPALEIGCRDGEWTNFLVASDPLYLADEHQEFLDVTIGNYAPEYQRRIRPYVITNDEYGILPQKQFNLVFSWNHFNYKSLDSIKKVLRQVYNLLRPGGVFMFSYNNGDLPDGAAYAESYFMSYVPKSMLIPACQQLGFEITYSQDYEPAVSWLELKKPGELFTVKGHQALGLIKEKTVE